MKILHVTNTLSEGGVESFLLQLLSQLVQHGCEVDVLVLNKNKTALRPEFEKYGIRVFSGQTGSPYSPVNICRIRKYMTDYDIVHVHLWPAQLWVAVATLGKYFSTCCMTTEHGSFNKRRQYRFYRPIEQWMYGRYRMIVGVSDTSRNNLLGWIKHSMVMSIPNGVDLSKFSGASPYSKNELELPDDAIVVTMVARFFEAKDHSTLIRAMMHTSANIYLLLVGSGEAMPACKEEARTSGLENRIRFLGRRADVPRIIASSDICVLSTHYEGLPISVLEYMAAGKPVIVTNVDGIPELMPDPYWMVAPQNAEELSRKIMELSSDRILRERIGASNQKRAADYDLNVMVDKYIRVYQSLIGSK